MVTQNVLIRKHNKKGLMRHSEQLIFVFYDIENNRKRTRAYTICKDYGLTPVQYSVFCGSLTRTKTEELYNRLTREIGKDAAHIWIVPTEISTLNKTLTHGSPLGIMQRSKEGVRIYG